MIFVTGGTGLLGSHLLIELSQSNDIIKASYRSQKKIDQLKKLFQYYLKKDWEAHFNKIEWHQGDILDIPFLQDVMTDCTQVYHCAALVSFYRKDFNNCMKINREGTANIVNVCLDKNIDKLCYVSSTAAIGGENHKIISEKYKWKNTPTTSGYSISKYSAEKEVWRGIEEGLNAVMVNPCVILGAGNWNDSSLTIFKTMRKGVKFYPPGSNAQVDARDVAEIMMQLMNSNISSQRFLCIGSNQSFKELMTVIATENNVNAPSIAVKKWMVEPVRIFAGIASFFTRKKPSITRETINSLFGHLSYDNSKICAELNFEFRSLEETVKNGIEGRIS
ncbi:MAG TPA: NAD-dependent epimerase/dehydratase family protein [Crocinitomicaceae bacterium]|nr:NAD-dependent epimerase/dehydratase family protein [Crocinitomicaceae bacterium]